MVSLQAANAPEDRLGLNISITKYELKPDLILLDLILPDINGAEILKTLKGDEALKSISLFVLTNYTDPKLEKEIWKSGAEKFLVKTNCIPSQLVSIINEWFKNPEK